MKIVICGSTNVSLADITNAAEHFRTLFSKIEDVEIITPDVDAGPFYLKQLRYACAIKTADLVVIVPKNITYHGYETLCYIGDSTNYEMAIAKSNGIPTVIWKGDM